jgi:competence protein ComEC
VKRIRVVPRWLLAFAALLAVANVWVWFLVWRGPGLLVVTFLDVGQGDAIVVQTPDGHVLLVDTGPVGEADDMGRRVVLPFLRSRGIWSIDAILLTHPHDDHIGGAESIMGRVGVGHLLVSSERFAEPAFQRLLKNAHRRGVNVVTLSRGEGFIMGSEVRGEVLNPIEGAPVSANNGSLAIRLRYGTTSVLLAGDSESDAEAEMVRKCDLRADVLKLSHHGSKTSTTAGFLAAIRPQAAVVSVGKHNLFGHPSPEVVERVSGASIPLFRTDRDGAVEVESDGRSLAIHPGPGPHP